MNTLEISQKLTAPFDPGEVHWKPASVSGNRALAVAYIDARVVQDRLDEVVGPANWQDDYEVLQDNNVICRLRIRFGDEWVTKVDVGSPSEQPDDGDRCKASFSDALKRAAVKFGVGRYLYSIPRQWVDYDPQKKQLKNLPSLPKPTASPPPAQKQEDRPASKTSNSQKPPADGLELEARLHKIDAWAVSQGLCPKGALVSRVREMAMEEGWPQEIVQWKTDAEHWRQVQVAIEHVVGEMRAVKKEASHESAAS